MRRILLLLALLWGTKAFGQATQIATFPADPATCDPTVGQIFFNNSTLPAVLKYCSALNTWTAVGGGTGGTLFPWTTLASTTTPALAVNNGAVNYYMQVTGNISAVTTTGVAPNGTFLGIDFQEDGTGGHTIPTGNFPANFIFPPGCAFVTTANSNNWLAWTFDGTNWQPVAGSCAGSGNTVSTSLTTNKLPKANGANSIIDSSVTDNGTTVSTTEDSQFKGPNPSVDIRAFGAIAVNTGIAPFTPSITATCNGTTTLTISAASSFVNGQGVAVANCGATNTMGTPSAPTVTSSLAAGPPGSGYVVAGAAGGAETTCYVYVASDQGRGLTAKSGETCVTGQTRGVQTVNITSCVRSANTLVTCTTSAHTLAVGAWVKINGTTLDSEYGGYHILTAVPDNTHFSYQWSRDSRAGASTVTATGGTVTYWQGNHIVPQAPGAGYFQYGFYRGGTGAETFADVSMLVTPGVNNDSSYMVWDDFGTSYTTVPTGVSFVWPSSPPSSATSDLLVTTIASGAGTTTLTLANAATQSNSGVNIVTDNAPTIKAAFTAALASKGMVYFPAVASGTFGTNSVLDLTADTSVGASFANSAFWGDTVIYNGTWRGDLINNSISRTSFSLQSLTQMTINAKPGIYTSSGSFIGFYFKPQGTNCQDVFVGPGSIPTGLFYNDAFLGSASGTDFSCVPVILFTQGTAGSSAAGITFRDVAFIGNQAQGATPALISKNFSELTFDGVIQNGRGMMFSNCPTCTIAGISFNQRYENQGPVNPLFVTRGTMSLGTCGAVEDTGSQPIVSHLGGGPLFLNLCGASTPSGGIPQVTGTNIQSLAGISIPDTQQGVNINYSGTLTALIYDGVYNSTQAVQVNNTQFQVGQNYSLFTNNSAALAAPTCNVVTAGPPFSMSAFGSATYTFAYTAVFPNGGQSLASGTVTCAMDGATQQATITIPAAVLSATGYDLLFGTGGLGNYYTVTQTGLSILVPSCLTSCQGQSSPKAVGGGPAGMRNGLAWSDTFALGHSMNILETTAPSNPVAGTETLYADSGTHKLTCLTSTGANCLFPYAINSYAITHPLTINEQAVVATASGITFTLPHAAAGRAWDIYNTSGGTITLAIDSGTLSGNGATGPITVPANTGIRASCDGTNCEALGIGGGGGGGCTPGGLTDALQYNGGGTCSFGGVNSPVLNGNYIVNYNVTANAAVPPTITIPGVPQNPQTGTTYTYLYSDRGSRVTASNGSAQTYTLTNPSSAGFGFNYFNVLQNIGTGAVTDTASGFTIDGGTTLLIPPNWTRWLWSDGVNYFSHRAPDFKAFVNCTGAGNALQFTSATGVFSCGSSSSGVSSLTGDGVLITNSASTGAVTLTLGTALAHKVWMNNTGSTATPGYQSIGEADLPATTVFTDKAATFGAFLYDFSASTTKIPTGAGCTASASAMICYDSTNKNWHIYDNNADAIGCAFSSAPTTGDLVSVTVTSGQVLCSDSGTSNTNVVTAASAAAAAKQTCVSSGASKTCTYIDFPERYYIPSANCNNTTAGAGWSIGSGGTVTCRTGVNNKGGYIAITDTSTTFAQFTITVPNDWDSGTNPSVRFYIGYPGTDTGHTIIPAIQVSCSKGDGTTTDDVTFNASHSSSTTTTNATANQFWSNSTMTMNSTDVTGCVAGGQMTIQVGRATDTATSAANFYGADVTFPRLLTVGAE